MARTAKNKSAVKTIVDLNKAAVVETGGEIKRTNQFFMQIKSLGQCDAKGRSVFSVGYGGKSIAKPDRPLLLVGQWLREMLSFMDYSSDEAMELDIEQFKKFVAGFKSSAKGE